MSDNSFNTLLRNIDKTIKEALKVWEKFGFKNVNLWKIFQYNFKSFMKKDFKSANIHYQCKLGDYLQKYNI